MRRTKKSERSLESLLRKQGKDNIGAGDPLQVHQENNMKKGCVRNRDPGPGPDPDPDLGEIVLEENPKGNIDIGAVEKQNFFF